jgi:recombination protein RecT
VATSLNLSLNKGFGYAYLVPFNNKKTSTTEAQFQIGWKGYVQLAMRTGEYHKLNAVTIYKNQFVRWNELGEELTLNDVDGEGEVVGYVARFKLLNGFEKTMYWSYAKMLKHADTFSQAFKAAEYEKIKAGKIAQSELWRYSSFWYKSFDDMALKTMFRQLLSKYGILSAEMEKAYTYDQAIIDKDKVRYSDNESQLYVEVEEYREPRKNINAAISKKDEVVWEKQKEQDATKKAKDAIYAEVADDDFNPFDDVPKQEKKFSGLHYVGQFIGLGLKRQDINEFVAWANIDNSNINVILSDKGGLSAMIEEFNTTKAAQKEPSL